MFLAEPSAQMLYLGDAPQRGAISQPISILTNQGTTLGRRVVDVVLPKAMVLERTIAVPPSRASTHHAIALLDLVRRTPFVEQDIHWTLSGDATATSKTLHQLVVKRSDVAHYRAMLASHGFLVRKFVVAGARKPATLADFTSEIAPHARPWRRINLLLAIATIGAGLTLWLQPTWQAQSEIARQTAVVDELRNTALALRAEIEVLDQIDSERTDFVNSVMRRTRAIDALRQLSVVLPDDVWVSDFLFTSDRITLNGETSQSAADLVLALTQANLAYVPALAGPVSRTAEGKERFSLIFDAKGAMP